MNDIKTLISTHHLIKIEKKHESVISKIKIKNNLLNSSITSIIY